MVKKCIDPNTAMEVPAWNCGVDELPEMTRKCNNKMFPTCPR